MHNASVDASIAALTSPPIPDSAFVPGIAPRISRATSAVHALLRPEVRGKFIFAHDQKLFVRGVTYGAFRPDAEGREYQNLAAIECDFAHMAACGFNAVRIPHTMPERPVLDAARRHGLRVMVGLSAEQYVGFLIDRKKDVAEIAEIVRAKVRACAGHRALLCYSLGNEIPAPIARWLGRRTIERYLERLYCAVKEEDPGGLVTYVNYPTTEYLQLPFLDLVCFNVYLESRDRFESYLARLQNIAGSRPVMMSELGLDSLRNGDDAQARSLDFQVRAAFAGGCAGAFVFSWTDEWHRHGSKVEDWAFGLTRADRSPKPALEAVEKAFAELPFPCNGCWPRVSVVVCTYNGARTIRDCLDALEQLDYPDFEVIVVDDGSSDATAAIAREYDCRLIQTENRGLGSARNTGLREATGEIVAYIDDDAYPDPHWLKYLTSTFLN
ncbi:MAG: glycosyltransferase, partial [Chloroflexi bacterium]